MSNATETFRQLLQNLVGSGFTVSITVNGSSFNGLKVIAIVDDVVFTTTNAGVINVFSIPDIKRIDF